MTTFRPGGRGGCFPGSSEVPPGFSARAAMAALGALGMLEDVAAFATDLEVTRELLAVGAAPLSDALGADVAERSRSEADSLADGRALLESGAAGAVPDVAAPPGCRLPRRLPCPRRSGRAPTNERRSPRRIPPIVRRSAP